VVRLQVLTLDLREDPDLIEQYRAWHRPGAPPPAIIKALFATNITDMEIFMAGNRLVMIVLAQDDFSLKALAQLGVSNADVQAWETLMWKFQKALPWAQDGQKWVAMDRIFALSEH
jgi:L-rhamnose mutarotase